MTAYWQEDDLKRRSGCLGINRVKGQHPFDVIAAVINIIQKNFKIIGKLNVKTTESGSNFLKALKKFGTKELT